MSLFKNRFSEARPGFLKAMLGSLIVLAGCGSTAVEPPPVNKVLTVEAPGNAVSPANQRVDFNLDGTLSMQGFSRPKDEKFAQLLQDLDGALDSSWHAGNVHYHRFGSLIEDIRQQPFYVAASQETFYQRGKDYAETRIDNVFRKSAPGALTIVMTDLFEKDLNIAAIQDSLRSAAFPQKASLAIWQWEMPFSGAIFDFDFRNSAGHTYSGSRPLYMLALGPQQSLELLHHSIVNTVSVGQPKYLLITGNLASNSQDWLNVTQAQDLGLRRRVPASGQSPGYAVYRPSSGCSAAGFTADSKLTPISNTVVPAFAPRDGSYGADLVSVSGTAGKWSTQKLTGGATVSVKPAHVPGETLLTVRMPCSTLDASSLDLLTIQRMGAPDDIVLPDWIQNSSANVVAFNNAFEQHQSTWGDKTLNLAPLVRGLANTAVNGTVIASAYFYFVKS
ncbi:MAG: hypothetical protein WA324_16385 [Bryobacteraceae bacterium]